MLLLDQKVRFFYSEYTINFYETGNVKVTCNEINCFKFHVLTFGLKPVSDCN